MKGRGNPWLLFYLLLVIYGARAAGQETSTSPPGPITSAWEHTNSSGNKFGTTATNLPVTESTPLHENANVSAATNQSILHGSVAATASATTRNPNYTDTVQTTGLSTTVSTRNYSEFTVTVPTKPTPEMSDTPTTASTLSSNHSSSTGQPKTATGHSPDISIQPNTTALNNSTTSRTEQVEQTTPVILHQTNTTSLYTIHPSSTTSSYTNLSSRTEPITQHTSDISQSLTTTVLINNQTSSTEHPTQNTSDVSAHPTATHGPDISNSSVSPANTTSSASVNSTKHMSSTTDAANTMSVNSTRFPADTTHLPESTTNSSAYTTGLGIVATKHPNSSLTAETATTHSGSTVTNSSRTETPVTSTNATFTTQSYTSNRPQTNSSTFVTNTTAPAEHSTTAPNGTTWGMSSFTTKIVPSGSSFSPSTRDHTEGSKKSTTATGFDGTTITDSNPCRNVTCPSLSICVPKSPGYSCVTGRTFPGQLNLKSRNYTPEMANEKSSAFIKTALEIEKVLKRILENKSGYISSTVQKLMSGSVIANVENIFLPSSSVTSNEIANEINTFIGSCADCGPLTKGDLYEEQDLCSLDTCDNMTTICSSSDGVFVCKCKDGYYQPFTLERSCLACLSGYKLEDKKCVKCPFGYAGFNCDDSSLLAVVVISCVLGSLLLILLLSLFIACYRSKKLQREAYEHEAYLMWPKQEFPKIPRVTMNRDSSQMDYGSKNILVDNEMSNGNTASPEASRMEGDLKTFSNKNPTRYSYLNHGQTNPYFVNEDN